MTVKKILLLASTILAVFLLLLVFFRSKEISENVFTQINDSSAINTLAIRFIKVLPGTFIMGRSVAIAPMNWDLPRHQVTLSKAFYLSECEITQDQWSKLMPINPSAVIGNDLPVYNLSWAEILEFINKLNDREKTSSYRLPTEAEWEYACRAGTDTAYFWGNDSTQKKLYAWFYDNAQFQPHPVATLEPNPWGFFDMLGNVDECCSDFFDKEYYKISPEMNPSGPKGHSPNKVTRGGNVFSQSILVRCGARSFIKKDKKEGPEAHRTHGFRLARDID